MGMKISATIAIGTAAALYGLGAVTNKSKQTQAQLAALQKQGMSAAAAMAAVQGAQSGQVGPWGGQNPSNSLGARAKVVANAVRGASNAVAGNFGKLKGNIAGVTPATIFGMSTAPTPKADLKAVHALEEQAAKAMAAALLAQKAIYTVSGATKKQTRNLQKAARAVYKQAQADARIATQAAKAARDQYSMTRRDAKDSTLKVKTNIAATNTMIAVAREARHWFRIFFKTTGAKGVRAHAVEAVTTAVQGTNTAIQKTQSSISGMKTGLLSLMSIAGGLLAAVGGAQLLGGASGFMERAFDLSRAREDSKVTFNTLLGSKQLTDQLITGISKYAAVTPFQTADLQAASQSLLSLSGKDVGKNEKMYKLAAQIAALKPGTSVEDVARGFVSGSYGEFEILKGMTFKLSAAQMKGAGQQGGQKYIDAMFKEIERQLQEKTGGRDLVAALGGTMSGLMSTIKDSLEIPLANLGDHIVKNLNIKEAMQGYIEQATVFGDYFSSLLSGDKYTGKVPPGIKAVADTLYYIVVKAETAAIAIRDFGLSAWDAFNKLSPGARQLIVNVGMFGTIMLGVAGIVLPILGALVTGFGMFVGAVGGLFTIGLPALVTALGGIQVVAIVAIPLMWGLTAAIGLATLAFMGFRHKGESLIDTLTRLGGGTLSSLLSALEPLQVFLSSTWDALSAQLLPAWHQLEDSFARLTPALETMTSSMKGSWVNMKDVADVGHSLGVVLGMLLRGAVWLADFGFAAIQRSLMALAPHWDALISDLKIVIKTFFAMASGRMSLFDGMRLAFMGMVDIVLTPFRIILEQMFSATSQVLQKAAIMVAPFSQQLGNALLGASMAAKSAGLSVTQGFVSTRHDNMSASVAVNIKHETTVKMDGDKVAKAVATSDMRARNSGRGGDPMPPEEMGFVISNGKISPVALTSVASGI